MAIDLLAGMDETDDGEWATCWDFDRNDWGKGSWGAASTWGTANKGQYTPWWSQASPAPATEWKPGGQQLAASDGPFAGDAILQAMPSPWWARGYAKMGEAPWGAGAARVQCDAPYWGDSDGTATAAMLALGMPGLPLVAPPPPPEFNYTEEGEMYDKQHPWSKKSGAGKDKRSKKDGKEDGSPEKPKKGRRSLDGGSRETKDEILVAVEEALAINNIVQKADFDSGVRRYLGALRGCQGGQQKVKDALAMIHTYTVSKQRSSVKNWPAYLLTLLKRFEPDVFAKMQAAKGEGKGDSRPYEMSAGEAAARALPSRVVEPPPGMAPKSPKAPPKLEPEPSGPAITLPEVIPDSWFAGRAPLLAEVANLLGKPKCPFTGKLMDFQENLALEMASCLGAQADKSTLWRHVAGATGCRDLVECPRAVEAGAKADVPEFRALAEDARSMDGIKAIALAAKKRPLGSAAAVAKTVQTEIGLEVLAELLRNPKLKTQTS
mmetsp:Transcript_30678/g.55657  ORF Transcript_30678/g.55657 Transcript_30678/m.55657 type:complete len:492 (+) Transcript_30678:131-1606(+)